ncbi:hypothetical protein [Methylophilus sp. Leaf414]|uniref:hypothetical protein n=1 Tax=Methylophilus sp. Leaf414 TaxID=1736371 RepID=UPI0006FE692F|nr:hypothetical protein [Methylophilus sp. Leaf414]KQT38208.1 hypothetical protein ASG24_04445 [Methylophilus sp. Leaf414]
MKLLYFIVFLVCAFCCSTASAEKPEWAVALVNTKVHAFASSDSSIIHELSIGDRLLIVERDVSGTWVRDRDSGWVLTSTTAFLRHLEKVRSWRGPKSIEIENGDFSGTYQFRRNGSFTLTSAGNDGADEYSGHLFKKGLVVFAKKSGEPDFGDVFVWNGASFCWTTDSKQCSK